MKLRFCLLISRPMQAFVNGVLDGLKHYCNVDVLVAESNEHARALYEAHWPEYDAFVFGGKVFQYSVTQQLSPLPRPCFALDNSAGDVKDLLLQLMLQNRDFDFSRTFIDTAYENNNYMGLKELLPEQQWPYFAENIFQKLGPLSVTSDNIEEVTRAVLNRHVQLHREGKIDLSITRFGALADELRGMGLPCAYMLPTKEYIIGFFMELIYTLGRSVPQNQMMGAVMLGFKQVKGDREALIAQVGRQVMEYAGINELDFNVERENDTLQILMPYQNLRRITVGFSQVGFYCQLVPENQPVSLGLGTGKSMYQAKSNGQDALDISQNNWEDVYFITYEDKIIGPMGKGYLEFDKVAARRLQELAERYEVDHVTLQKVITFAQVSDSRIVTSQDLAKFMGVTARTGNRILDRLLQKGGAEVRLEKSDGKPGRPKKCYELTFVPLVPPTAHKRDMAT